MTQKEEKPVVLLAIGGASSSGKTTLARLLHFIIQDSVLVHQDDFYKNDKDIPIDPATSEQNWDCPEAIDFVQFEDELRNLKETGQRLKTNSKTYETNDSTLDKFSISEETISSIRRVFEGQRVVLVEGFMLFHDNLYLLPMFDKNIFLRASYQTLKKRRENRSYLTQETVWVDPPGYFDKLVYPAYAQTHGYLFEQDNVELELKPEYSKKLNSFANNEGVLVSDILQWCVGVL